MRGLDTGEGALPIVETIICLARKMNWRIVAEGIETERDLEILLSMGAMDLQGYYFSRPKPAEEIESNLPAWLSGSEMSKVPQPVLRSRD